MTRLFLVNSLGVKLLELADFGSPKTGVCIGVGSGEIQLFPNLSVYYYTFNLYIADVIPSYILAW